MDRCRCEEYADAVKKLKFYTVGTLRPDIIENYDRSSYRVAWIKHGVDYEDMKFLKPKAWRVKPEQVDTRSPEEKKIERMWCPYMTPVNR